MRSRPVQTVWERFDSALGGIAASRLPFALGWREYNANVDNAQFGFRAQYFHDGMLFLTCLVDKCVRTFTELLIANGKSRVWKFALSTGRVVLQTEIFADEFERARDIVSSVCQPRSYATGELDQIVTNDDCRAGEDDVLIKRIRAFMQAEAPQFVNKENGSCGIDVRHAGEKASHPLVCTPVSGGLIEIRSLISTVKIETEGARHYLLCRTADLKGCRAAVDDSGFPFIVTFFPYSSIEGGGLLARLEAISHGLFGIRHVRTLHHHLVNHLYQSMYIAKKGDTDYGIDASRN
jgi:hypothetical protein